MLGSALRLAAFIHPLPPEHGVHVVNAFELSQAYLHWTSRGSLAKTLLFNEVIGLIVKKKIRMLN